MNQLHSAVQAPAETHVANYAIPPAKNRPRLVVVIREVEEEALLAGRIQELARARGLPVLLLGVARDSSTEAKLKRGLITIAAFLRDVLGFQGVDAGGGWPIFGLPPSEMAVHPSDDNDVHELYLLVDDLRGLVRSLREKGVATTPTSWMSPAAGSSIFGSRCAARKIRLSGVRRAASSAAMDDARPTTNGAIIRGKTTMSLSGTSGSVRVAGRAGGVAGEVIRVYLVMRGTLAPRRGGGGPVIASGRALSRPSGATGSARCAAGRRPS